MQPGNQPSPSEDRLSIRANAKQKQVLRRAAEVRHTSMSQFVLEASLNEADRVLQEEQRLVLSADEFELMAKLMDQPARDLPALRELLNEKPVWDA
ncbi:MAG: DUF1778 domain-containing protein [Chthonomonas sp.]|nr:DUF1778 domain-containing protein [Chthonomonas sp.]